MPHCSVAGQKKIFFIPTKQKKYFLTFMFLANAKLGRNLWWASIMPQCSFPLKSIQIPQSECKIIGIPDSGIAKVLWINLQGNVHDYTMHTQNHLLSKLQNTNLLSPRVTIYTRDGRPPRPAEKQAAPPCPTPRKVGPAPPRKIDEIRGAQRGKTDSRFHWYPFPLCPRLMMP